MPADNQKPLKVLLLGGSSEAALLAERLAGMQGMAATLSLAGRTAGPRHSPLPVRTGGFGGIYGLAAYLTREDIDIVVDATHPFAATISNNAVMACARAHVPLLAVERPPWIRVAGDDWEEHGSVAEAIDALPREPLKIFSGLGRQSIGALFAAPQHHYLIRVIDPLPSPPGLPHATIITDRGPFRTDDDVMLFKAHGIERILTKNSGGTAAYAKIEAARRLGLKVHIIRRPLIAERQTVPTVGDALEWITAHQSSRTDRGV